MAWRGEYTSPLHRLSWKRCVSSRWAFVHRVVSFLSVVSHFLQYRRMAWAGNHTLSLWNRAIARTSSKPTPPWKWRCSVCTCSLADAAGLTFLRSRRGSLSLFCCACCVLVVSCCAQAWMVGLRRVMAMQRGPEFMGMAPVASPRSVILHFIISVLTSSQQRNSSKRNWKSGGWRLPQETALQHS